MSTDYFDEFYDKIKEEMNKMGTANIMISGKTGVGKSTLINNVFRDNLAKTGIGSPVSQHINKTTKKGIPLTIYDTCVFRRHPDTDSGNIRTAYRNYPDNVSETSGHLAWLIN